jgi:hypothetical protein
MRRLVKKPNIPVGGLTVDDEALLTAIFLGSGNEGSSGIDHDAAISLLIRADVLVAFDGCTFQTHAANFARGHVPPENEILVMAASRGSQRQVQRRAFESRLGQSG